MGKESSQQRKERTSIYDLISNIRTFSTSLIDALQTGLQIQGIEATQATQHMNSGNHLTDPKDYGENNSLELAHNKPALVRVYVEAFFPYIHSKKAIYNVTGELRVWKRPKLEGETPAPIEPVEKLSPINPFPITAAANPGYDWYRYYPSSTLNFIIPGDKMEPGNYAVTASVSAPRPNLPPFEATASTNMHVESMKPLKIFGLLFEFVKTDAEGNEIYTVPPPTSDDFVRLIEKSYSIYPVPTPSEIDINIIGRETVKGNQIKLEDIVDKMEKIGIADGSKGVYLGILPDGTEADWGGMAVLGGTGAVVVDDNFGSDTTAHEVGHIFGFNHTPDVGDELVDGKYPAYEPYDLPEQPTGIIGEYGTNLNDLTNLETGGQYRPRYEEVMSDGNESWISPYHHKKAAQRRAVVRKKATPYIIIQGYLDSLVIEQDYKITSVFRLNLPFERPSGTPTDLIASLITNEGKVLSRDRVYKRAISETEGQYLLKAYVIDDKRGDKLQIQIGEEVIWSRTAADAEPEIEDTTVEIVDIDTVRLEWNVTTYSEIEPEAIVRWSADNGETWNVVTAGLEEEFLEINTDILPKEKEVVFEILINDGFETVSAVTDVITLPPETSSVSAEIFHPRNEDLLSRYNPLRLWGIVILPAQEDIPEENYQWYLNGSKVETGRDNWIDNPGSGDHNVTLRVDTDQGTAEKTVSFEIL